MAGYNFISYDATLNIDRKCTYDSNIGYSSDFSVNGEVDGWELYDGIHTYSAWSGFLFGTLYTDFAMIGRDENIFPVDGETYYMFVVTMLIKPTKRYNEQQKPPTKAKVMWTTFADDDWDDNKSKIFDIYPDNTWHTYNINMAEEQYWIGDISNLRFYPIYENGKEDDEFAIKRIQIKSVDYYECDQMDCSYYPKYKHPCPGVGNRGYCESKSTDLDVFSIETGFNDTLIININNYGFETVRIPSGHKVSPNQLAVDLTKNIGVINVGGFAEAQVVYSVYETFIIYTGTYTDDSIIELKYTKLAEEMGFFDENKNPIYDSGLGITPATKYVPFSTFLLTYNQLLNVFDNNENTYVSYNPSIYNIEGGRSDWLMSGPGGVSFKSSPTTTEWVDGGEPNISTSYNKINGIGKTIIDTDHPFNASGRIKKIHVCGTVDYGYESVTHGDGGQLCSNGEYGWGRLYATGVKVKIFRPRKNGTLEVIHELDVEDRPDPKIENNNLIAEDQYHTEVDCDIFVNKGDLLGVYNISLYSGKTLDESKDVSQADATYYHMDGDFEVGEVLLPGNLTGNGSAGLLLYGRSDVVQDRLAVTIDLNDRVNINTLYTEGYVENSDIEFNIMRCRDIDWDIDLFGGQHRIGFRHALDWGRWIIHVVPNKYFGKENLTDGKYTVKNGLAADAGFSVENEEGVIPDEPNYFWVNGDHEWLGVYHWPEWWRSQKTVWDFSEDPIAFTAIFPHGKKKKIHRSAIYFKEKLNFRNFALSTYLGPNGSIGNADDIRFMLIPEYKAVALDGLEYSEEKGNTSYVKDYLFENPSIGQPDYELTSGPGLEFPGDAAIPGDWTYYAGGHITNYDEWSDAINLHWNVLEHQWDPIDVYGFRFYTDYHKSTAITEMELYGYIEHFSADVASSLFVTSSFYGDVWFDHSVLQKTDEEALCYVDNSVRYIYLEFEPVDTFYIKNITASTTDSYIYYGDKGCEDSVYLNNNKIGKVNDSQLIKIKNVYGGDYNLFVDIPEDVGYNERILYFSSLNNEDSLTNPEIGPGTVFSFEEPYFLLNSDHNVSINCKSYGLVNSILGKKAYYNYNNLINWLEYNNGNKVDTDYVDFHNLPTNSYSIINIPNLSRNRFWRLEASSYYNDIKINELKVYKNGRIVDCDIYHNRGADVTTGGLGRRAPHLQNDSVTGSYYRLAEDQYITIDLGQVDNFDTILFYHDTVIPYSNIDRLTPDFFCGVDKHTQLYIEDDVFEDYIKDNSYYEHKILNTEKVDYDTNYYNYEFSRDYDFATDLVSYQDWWFSSYREGDIGEFVPASGTAVSGTTSSGTFYPGYVYMDVLAASSDRPYFHLITAPEDLQLYSYRGFQNPPFDIKTKITFEEDVVHSEIYWEYVTFLCGCLGTPNRPNYYWRSVSGAYIMYSNDHGLGIVVAETGGYRDDIEHTTFISYDITKGDTHYCHFTYDGEVTYKLRVWSDDWEGEDVVCDLELQSEKEWECRDIGFTTGDGGNDKRIKASIYNFEINYESIQPAHLDYWHNSLKFNGKDNSYLKIPYSDVFDLSSYKYSFDFFIRFDEFPFPTFDVANEDDYIISYGLETNELGRFGWQADFRSDSYIQIKHNERFNLGSNLFTFDFILQFFGEYSKQVLFYRAESFCMYYDFVDKKLVFEGYDYNNDIVPELTAELYHQFDLDIKYHVALSRVDNELRLFVDGEYVNNSTISGSYNFPFDLANEGYYDFYIGGEVQDGEVVDGLYGNIEEVRLTKNISRWSEGFDLPVTPYNLDDYTYMLLRFKQRHVNLIENYDYRFGVSSDKKGFVIRLVQEGIKPYFEFLYNSDSYFFDIPDSYNIIRKNMWYHVLITNAFSSGSSNYRNWGISVNGKRIINTGDSANNFPINPGFNDIIIGRQFKGNLKNLRFSKTSTEIDEDWEGVRISTIDSGDSSPGTYPVPFYGYSKLYEFKLYSSYDASMFNKVYDLDLMLSNSYNYYHIQNIFSAYYNSFFAVDLGKRYNLDIVRSYGSADAHNFNILTNTFYSNKDTNDVNEIFYEFDPTDYFKAYDRTLPEKYRIEKSNSNNILYNLDNSLFFKIGSDQEEDSYNSATARYFILGNFDIQFRYYVYKDAGYDWTFSFILNNMNKEEEELVFERGFIQGNSKYRIKVKDKFYTSYHTVYEGNTFDSVKDIRVVKESSLITFYMKAITVDSWNKIKSFHLNTDYWMYNKPSFMLNSFAPVVPDIEVGLDNFIANEGSFRYDDYTDARWVIVALLNGDGVSRFINKMGVYTNIQSTIAPPGGYYNNTWDYLGKALTSPTVDTNVALGANVEASSYVADMIPGKITDGSKSFGEDKVWGSKEESNPYVTIDLGSIFLINKIKVYHGMKEESSIYLINNYTLEYSTDGSNFDVIRTITDNGAMEEIHTLFPSINMRYIKINITSYSSRAVYFTSDDKVSSYYFRGAVLREVEAIKDDGRSLVVSSEEYPIIATNVGNHNYLSVLLNYKFRTHPNRSSSSYILLGSNNPILDHIKPGDFITIWDDEKEEHRYTVKELDHDIYKGGPYVITMEDINTTFLAYSAAILESWAYQAEGVDEEGFDTNWPLRYPNLCHSDNFTDDIRKVKFRDFGDKEGYDKWVVFKNDTATDYNEGPDYFNKLKLTSVKKPNPVDYWWWWSSDHSIISNSMRYSPLVSNSLLRIYYPNSTLMDNIHVLEVSDYDSDDNWTWRDGFSFILYIDSLENIDLTDGFVYVGGYDNTTYENPVVYRWYWNTISRFLKEGQNLLFLKFKEADEVIYTKRTAEKESIDYDTRDFSKALIKKIGINIRGKGTGDFELLIDGFLINRNIFESYLVKGDDRIERGCYINKGTQFSLPISGLSLSSGFISFWMSPDYKSDGIDTFGNNKIRNIFNIMNNNNDVFGCFVSNYGIEVYFGNIINGNLNNYMVGATQQEGGFAPGDIIHFAITFSNNGTSIDSTGSTVKLFINNGLYASIHETWEYLDSKYLQLNIGGKAPHAAISGVSVDNSSIDAVVGDLKIGNFCKTDFSEEMERGFDIDNMSVINSNQLIEISKDNVTFYRAGDIELPFSFDQVSDGEEIPIYIRSRLTDINWDLLRYRTSNLMIQWELPV